LNIAALRIVQRGFAGDFHLHLILSRGSKGDSEVHARRDLLSNRTIVRCLFCILEWVDCRVRRGRKRGEANAREIGKRMQGWLRQKRPESRSEPGGRLKKWKNLSAHQVGKCALANIAHAIH
jgi:hypothetical protein